MGLAKEQDSTTGPDLPLMESRWGVPSLNPANRKTGKHHDLAHVLPGFPVLFYWTDLCAALFCFYFFLFVDTVISSPSRISEMVPFLSVR